MTYMPCEVSLSMSSGDTSASLLTCHSLRVIGLRRHHGLSTDQSLARDVRHIIRRRVASRR